MKQSESYCGWLLTKSIVLKFGLDVYSFGKSSITILRCCNQNTLPYSFQIFLPGNGLKLSRDHGQVIATILRHSDPLVPKGTSLHLVMKFFPWQALQTYFETKQSISQKLNGLTVIKNRQAVIYLPDTMLSSSSRSSVKACCRIPSCRSLQQT